MSRPDVLAAVDLGSNSFHLLVARVADGVVYPLDALREPVRLGAGLGPDKRLDRATQARALEALGRIGERLRGMPRDAVRAVGTNALRVAKNAPQFLREARRVLGFPIEVIAGREEARLIYLGVVHTLPPAAHRRLVVDIGGGSTELIIGAGLQPQLTESLYIGCVSASLRFFPDGRVDKARMKSAEMAARQELAAVAGAYRAHGWQEAIGASGSVRATEAILHAHGWSSDGITREGVERLRALLIKLEGADPDRIAGLRPGRAPVLPGGVAILGAVLDELGIERLHVAEGALRHGVLYDLLGRVEQRDVRAATVAQLIERYHVDPAQGERVRALALRIHEQLEPPRASPEQKADRLLLGWAGLLAEIGLAIEHSQYHKHSAYLLAHADLPGFSRMEQARLARLVLAHRGKLAKLRDEELEPADWRMVFALRIAALLLRRRTDVELPPFRVEASEDGFAIALPADWLQRNPLSAAALESEVEHWKAVGLRLAVSAIGERRLATRG